MYAWVKIKSIVCLKRENLQLWCIYQWSCIVYVAHTLIFFCYHICQYTLRYDTLALTCTLTFVHTMCASIVLPWSIPLYSVACICTFVHVPAPGTIRVFRLYRVLCTRTFEHVPTPGACHCCIVLLVPCTVYLYLCACTCTIVPFCLYPYLCVCTCTSYHCTMYHSFSTRTLVHAPAPCTIVSFLFCPYLCVPLCMYLHFVPLYCSCCTRTHVHVPMTRTPHSPSQQSYRTLSLSISLKHWFHYL